MTIGKLNGQDVLRIASTAFALYSVVKTVRDARNDEDGLQLMEGLLRGATLTLSVLVIVRNLRENVDDTAIEEGPVT